jgi:hypothetical protein
MHTLCDGRQHWKSLANFFFFLIPLVLLFRPFGAWEKPLDRLHGSHTAVSQREEKQIVDGVASQKIVSTKRMTHSVVNNCDYVVFSFYFIFN